MMDWKTYPQFAGRQNARMVKQNFDPYILLQIAETCSDYQYCQFPKSCASKNASSNKFFNLRLSKSKLARHFRPEESIIPIVAVAS